MFLSYLPLAHIFDRVAEELFLGLGAKIGYWQGSAKTLMDDVGELRPTVFVGVPRIFDRLYSGVTDKVGAPTAPTTTCERAAPRCDPELVRRVTGGAYRCRAAAALQRRCSAAASS